jgi:Family of unknown function (DUF6090)
MLKFFRKIRQDLVATGKTGKYLKYAIGEIVLVMIGILLALQVNNWNNERIRQQEEQAIIAQLIADLKESQKDLEKRITWETEMAQASAKVCHAFWKKNPPNDSIFKHMLRPLGSFTYSPTLGTARSLINSGNINIIKSDSIKNFITTYVEKVDYKVQDIKRYEETYYRKGVELLKQVVPSSSLHPTSYFTEFLNHSSKQDNELSRDDEFRTMPNEIEKIPFKADLQSLFNNLKIYTAYSHFLIAHRNSGNRYNDMLNRTNKLLEHLEKAKK